MSVAVPISWSAEYRYINNCQLELYSFQHLLLNPEQKTHASQTQPVENICFDNSVGDFCS